MTCALLAKTALVELLKLPFRMIKMLFYRLADLATCEAVYQDAIRLEIMGLGPPETWNENYDIFWILVTVIVAILFGGIHCAGWNFPFPSHAELIIWRVSSLIILIVPCTIPVIAEPVGTIRVAVLAFVVVMYVLARLTLFVEAFIALRHLPRGAYAVVEWTALLLHM